MELRIPPVLLFLLCAALVWALAVAGPQAWRFGPPLSTYGVGALTVVAAAVAVAAVLAFRRARTTVNPLDPAAATVLVTGSVFRRTRNPMYLALTLLLVAWALRLGQPLALCVPLLFVAWLNRFQIRPEEQALQAVFGAQYERYRSRVRRWL